jgi:hypothetical protein
VGGRGMPAYRETLVRLGAILVADLVQLGLALDRLRQPGRKVTPEWRLVKAEAFL